MNQERTGWPPGLLQDDSRPLSRWFASRPDARHTFNRGTEMTTTHTPGPWTAIDVEGDPSRSFTIDAGVHIGSLAVWPVAADEMQANARLIASAPDLLSQAQWAVAALQQAGVHPSYYAGLIEAIAKAGGEA
jgi:hypothetical protein